MKKLEYYISFGRDNNFNLIRFLAALAVIYSHCFPISQGAAALEPFESTLGISLGEIAVHVFFVTSGFLVTGSIIKKKELVGFFFARILRIFPALIVSGLFVVLICGVIETKLNFIDYLQSPEVLKYFLQNTLLIVHKVSYFLPSVFMDTPYVGVVNGSLWSLPWELKMYIILAGIFFLFKKKFGMFVISLYILSFVYFICNEFFLDFGSIFFTHLFYLSILFFSGSLFYIYSDRIPINTLFFISIVFFLTLLVIFLDLKIFTFFYYFLFPYVVLYLAYVPSGFIRLFNKLGDYSYGLYIYAFPIQQLVVSFFKDITPIMLFNYSFPIIFILSFFSWVFVEKPALKFKLKR